MLLKDLKDKKEFKVKRIDYNFIPNNEIIKNFEKELKKNNLKILHIQEVSNTREYTLYKDGEFTHRYTMASWRKTEKEKDDFLKDITEACDLPVLKSYRDDEYIYIVTNGSKVYYTLRLNNPIRDRVVNGKLVFRSNDYYFEYVKDDVTHRIYGDKINKNQLSDTGITIKDKHANIYYEFI